MAKENNSTMKHKHQSRRFEQLLISPSEIFTTIIRELQHARKNIDMEFYIFEGDRIGTTIAHILCRKARQGVRVRLLVDGYGSRNLPRGVRRQMINNGIQLRIAHNIGHHRNHRKIILIDDAHAFIGGVNIADRYLFGNQLGVWHDAVLHIYSNNIDTLSALFEYDFRAEPHRGTLEPQPHHTPALYWSESGGGGGIARLLRDVVESAERNIIITTPYLIPPRQVLDMLSKSINRGVKIKIIIPHRCDIWFLDNIIRHSILQTINRGVDIRIVRNGFIHAKLALVDSHRLVIGSANLDSRSLNINREVMLSTSNHEVCKTARLFFRRLEADATPPSEADIKSQLPKIITEALTPLM